LYRIIVKSVGRNRESLLALLPLQIPTTKERGGVKIADVE
jgi:hypothetical protein